MVDNLCASCDFTSPFCFRFLLFYFISLIFRLYACWSRSKSRATLDERYIPPGRPSLSAELYFYSFLPTSDIYLLWSKRARLKPMAHFVPQPRDRLEAPICNAIEAKDFKQALKLVEKRLTKSSDPYLKVCSTRFAGHTCPLNTTLCGQNFVLYTYWFLCRRSGL